MMRALVLALLAACASAALHPGLVEHQLQVDPSEVPEHLRHLLAEDGAKFPVVRNAALNSQSENYLRYVQERASGALQEVRPCSADRRVARGVGGGAGSSGNGSWCSSQKSSSQRGKRLWHT